jgi:hypothetical protein
MTDGAGVGTGGPSGAGGGDARSSRAGAAAEWGAGALSAAAAACVSVALVWAPQEQVVWQPPRWGAADRSPPPDAHRLDFRAPDGQPLLAWAVAPARGVRRGTLLAFHGNAELAAWGVPWARRVAHHTGWRVVLAEYRGYAGLGGAPSYAHSAGDARAAYDAALRAGPAAADGPVALFGHSLGSAVATELAAELAAQGRAPGALVLQSPFTSVRAMARVRAWPALDAWWRRVARVRFDTGARVAALDVPVWVAHGALDLVVPAWMGRRVFAAARRPGALLVVPRCGHNRVPARGGARYWQWLAAALDRAARR